MSPTATPCSEAEVSAVTDPATENSLSIVSAVIVAATEDSRIDQYSAPPAPTPTLAPPLDSEKVTLDVPLDSGCADSSQLRSLTFALALAPTRARELRRGGRGGTDRSSISTETTDPNETSALRPDCLTESSPKSSAEPERKSRGGSRCDAAA